MSIKPEIPVWETFGKHLADVLRANTVALEAAAELVRPYTEREIAALHRDTWPVACEEFADHADMDYMLWKAAPVLAVPKMATFEPLAANGHRFLVASSGLWLECRRPWLYLLRPIAPQAGSAVALPFGDLAPSIRLAFGKVPHDFIRGFAEMARKTMPNEHAAFVQWEEPSGQPGAPATGRLVWEPAHINAATPVSVEVQRPVSEEGYSIAIDFHSHGASAAFFSDTDDADDRHEVKIAIVVGNLDQPVPSIAARLCCLGLMLPVNVKAADVFGEGA